MTMESTPRGRDRRGQTTLKSISRAPRTNCSSLTSPRWLEARGIAQDRSPHAERGAHPAACWSRHGFACRLQAEHWNCLTALRSQVTRLRRGQDSQRPPPPHGSLVRQPPSRFRRRLRDDALRAIGASCGLADFRVSRSRFRRARFCSQASPNRSAQDWFDEFADHCGNAIGNTYLPVFRLSDGEFYFSIGYRVPLPEPGSNAVLHYLRHAVSYVKYGKHRTFWSGTPGYGYETYAGGEWTSLRKKYIQCLRQIAAQGLLATALVRTPNHYSERYHRPICGWFERHRVPLTPANYYPFHFVYALLNGPRRSRILRGRRGARGHRADP